MVRLPFDNLWTVVTNYLKSGNVLLGITIPVTIIGFLYRCSYLKRFVVTGGWILIFKSLCDIEAEVGFSILLS